MKRIIVIVVLLISNVIAVFSQDTINNFTIENNSIVWKKIYETSLSFEQLAEKIKDSGFFIKPDINGNKLYGDLNSIDADYRGAGYSEFGTAICIARSHFHSFGIVEYKEAKYRVTVKNIMLSQKYSDPLTKQGETKNLDFFYLKKNGVEFENSFKKQASIILDFTFKNKFDFTKSSTDSW